MKLRKPNSKELEYLKKFCGTPEPGYKAYGVGKGTIQSLLDEGWIRKNTDPNYDPSDYEITDEGEKALLL